jgi:hypothetical protein
MSEKLQSPVRQGKAENESGEAIATIWPERDGLMFAMDYRSRPLKTEWGVRLRGATKDEIYTFIERWLMQCPASDLMATAIHELGKDHPGFLPE